ncbi:hypothetical protein FOL47_002906 [Perkinsus chesapeaki]|uniref:Uncharacterized protein n=1 Tax=Perkinsus chesapeaki TaxID=330153 RepID=A0A7J6MCJ3_PERCH|nr:hypothetical protein FOL47_002906 [Perkinsus chesapeaki]
MVIGSESTSSINAEEGFLNPVEEGKTVVEQCERKGGSDELCAWARSTAEEAARRHKMGVPSWDRQSKIGLFVTKLSTALDEYNLSLPERDRLCEAARSRLVPDRLIANVSGGAKTALRNRKPSSVAEMCKIVEDHTSRDDPVERSGPMPAAPAYHPSSLIRLYSSSSGIGNHPPFQVYHRLETFKLKGIVIVGAMVGPSYVYQGCLQMAKGKKLVSQTVYIYNF